MAYQTGSATDQVDLMSKLSTFAQANGFVEEYYNATTRFLVLSRAADSLYVTFYWDGTNNIRMWQSLGYSAGSAETPWLQLDDSGNPGNTLSNPSYGRGINAIGAGPYTSYDFFAYTSPYAIHVVLEFSAGLYRHFAFGQLNKSGTWTGGAFAAGCRWEPGVSFSISDADSLYHSVLLDAVYGPTANVQTFNAGATIHMEGLPGQASTGKWGECGSTVSSTVHPGDDYAGNDREIIVGGFRGGIGVNQWGWLLPDMAAGFIPIVPIDCFFYDSLGGNDGWYYLGNMANVGHIHLHGIDPGQEITVGADTWIAFPAIRKSNVGGSNQESMNMGIIYKKVT